MSELHTQARAWLETEGLAHLLPDPHSHEDIRDCITAHYPGGARAFLADCGISVRSPLTPEKILAVERVESGESARHVAESIGCHPWSIYRWKRMAEQRVVASKSSLALKAGEPKTEIAAHFGCCAKTVRNIELEAR